MVVLAALLAAAFSGAAQSANPPVPPAKAKPQATEPSAEPKGQVIFERSVDENGNSTSKSSPVTAPSAQMVGAPSVEDADRQAVTLTSLDLDVHLQTAAQQMVVRALVTVRNTGKAPLARIPLQISSSLNWERIRIGGRDLSFPVATLNSDADFMRRRFH